MDISTASLVGKSCASRFSGFQEYFQHFWKQKRHVRLQFRNYGSQLSSVKMLKQHRPWFSASVTSFGSVIPRILWATLDWLNTLARTEYLLHQHTSLDFTSGQPTPQKPCVPYIQVNLFALHFLEKSMGFSMAKWSRQWFTTVDGSEIPNNHLEWC